MDEWKMQSSSYQPVQDESQPVQVSCPMCKEPYIGGPLHRYLKNKLQSFLFKCKAEECKDRKVMDYDKLIEH